MPEPALRPVARTAAPRFSGFIIVRLSAELPAFNDADDLRELADGLNLSGLIAVLDEFSLDTSRRMVKSVAPEHILELEQAAGKTNYPPLHSLTSYWRVDGRHLQDRTAAALESFNELSEVDLAYAERVVTEPAVNPGDDPFAFDQHYLDAAGKGIDAWWAWGQPDGLGAGVTLVDLEQGWFLNHEDLVGKSPTLIYGDNRDGVNGFKGTHGTAVLGVAIAEDNAVGVVGAAPGVTSVKLVSHYDRATDTDLHVADGIVAAIAAMAVADVLLLEVERDLLPTETDDADFDAIRLASAHAMIVIEPAGNKGANLDLYQHVTSSALILNRGSVGFRESGAIMVGAAESAVPHDRHPDSCYGSRVDCHAWGENIVTCGGGDLYDGGGNDDRSYTAKFGGTSGAAAIVAGAALVLQGKYKTTGTPLSPGHMRSLLSDPATGTPQGTSRPGNIGLMPNLLGLFEKQNLVPDVYVRDNTGDTGLTPSTGVISTSPDIIVRPTAVANPNASFGQGSGVEDSMTLGFEVAAGQDNFVYVRFKNRGLGDASDTTATVYWSEVSALVTPDMWTPIGTTAPVTAPAGDTLVVAGPLTWPAADIPAAGHYCFVAVLNDPTAPVANVPADVGPPPPPGPPYFDFDDFRAYVRNHNNVTWRNFNVVDAITTNESASLPMMFHGGPDGPRRFDIEIVRRLPASAKVLLEAPLSLATKLNARRQWRMRIDRRRGIAHLALPTLPRTLVRDVELGGRNRYRARLVVNGVREMERGGHSIVIRQLYRGDEVGRVTWWFHRRQRGER